VGTPSACRGQREGRRPPGRRPSHSAATARLRCGTLVARYSRTLRSTSTGRNATPSVGPAVAVRLRFARGSCEQDTPEDEIAPRPLRGSCGRGAVRQWLVRAGKPFWEELSLLVRMKRLARTRHTRPHRDRTAATPLPSRLTRTGRLALFGPEKTLHDPVLSSCGCCAVDRSRDSRTLHPTRNGHQTGPSSDCAVASGSCERECRDTGNGPCGRSGRRTRPSNGVSCSHEPLASSTATAPPPHRSHTPPQPTPPLAPVRSLLARRPAVGVAVRWRCGRSWLGSCGCSIHRRFSPRITSGTITLTSDGF
jgi:hypothetical protein